MSLGTCRLGVLVGNVGAVRSNVSNVWAGVYGMKLVGYSCVEYKYYFILFCFLKDFKRGRGRGQEDSQPKAWGKS